METMDQMLLSGWCNVLSSVPPSYVQLPEDRPVGKVFSSSSREIPMVDLGRHDRGDIIKQILKASKEYGFFQVTNHGVSKDLIDETLNILKEFHAMPSKEKVNECFKDPNRNCKIYTSRNNDKPYEILIWKDTLTHPCPPSGEYVEYWPQKPTKYREVVGKYTSELNKLALEILELLGEGLELDNGYFCGALSENPSISVNHYPPCPDPSLTLGVPIHKDPSIITILLQDEEVQQGLQVLKDGQWIGVEPIPHVFVVNIGLLLQIITNGRLVAAEHRVVTNSSRARTSVAYLMYPSSECIIEPAQAFINGSPSATYKPMSFGEFRAKYLLKGYKQIEEELHIN
ncbi:hypothetical protein VNO78_33746 [Psophocarpus tetragonolobus]|uniref:Fe2OG dioxygenase domain-containing protein n=1 Tax=Psophocarpus tetragonolobus TaxID=3891 RepID=A0AAN9RLL8_PSOTE